MKGIKIIDLIGDITMKHTKRLFFALVTLCLLAGLLPTSAWAASKTAGFHLHPICGASCSHAEGHGAVSYTALTAAMINTGEITYYTLAAGNYYLSEDITTARTIKASGEVNLCLNGHTITCTEDAYMPVGRGATLYICDCQGGGGMTDKRTGMNAESGFVYVTGSGAATLCDGIFTGKSVLYVSGSGSTLTVDGATIKATKTALNAQPAATVHIKSGELTTSDAFYTVDSYSPNFTMTGGKVVNTKYGGEAVSFHTDGGGTISGGTIQATGSVGVGVSVGGRNNVVLSGAPVIEGKAANIQFSASSVATGLLTVGENLTGKFTVLRESWNTSGNFRVTETKPFPFTTAADGDDSDHFTSAISQLALRDVVDQETGKYTLELYRKHAWAKTWQKDETHHWHNCSNADCTVTDNASKDGYAAHTAVTDEAVDATCTTDGKTEGSHCSACGYVITAQTDIPATGIHTYPGYEKDDTQHWQKCSVCKTETPKAAHTAVTDEAVDATCTTDGKTEGSHCSACGYVITPQQTIPASHTWGKWTLQADGKTVKRICTVDDSHTESKALAITLDKLSYVYSGGENKPAVTVKANGAALTPGTDYAVSYKDNVNKGTATVTVTGKGDYAGSVDKTFTVTAKSLTATAAAATNRAYDGTAAVTVTAVTLDGVVGRDDVAVNTTGLKGTVSSPNASGTPYEMVSLNGLTLTGDKAGNYALAQVNVTLPTSVTISRAAPPTATAVSRNITNKLEKEYTFALANLLPQLNEEGITENRKDWGAPVYTIRSVSLPDGYYDGVNAPARIVREDDAAILHLPIRFNDVETTGEVGAVTVEIQSANYETFTNVLSIKANNKTSVQFEGISIASRTYNGQPIAHTGTLVVKTDTGADVTANIPEPHIEITYMGVDGTAYGGDRSKVPPTNAGSFVMVIRVADEDENYIGVTQFPFAISKAPGTGSVTMADFTCGGEPSVPVPASDTNGVDGVSYVYKVRGAADETYSTTKPTSPGTYTVRASFPTATNYQAVTATADFTVSHAWADTWSTDENGHWYECTACREKKDTAEHVYGSDRDLICAACGYDRTVTENQIKGEVEVNLGTGTPAVTTDTEVLKDLAGEIQKWQKVIVKLTVEKQDEPADKDEITELVTGRKDDVLYLNLSLLRQINAEEPEAITDTGSRVLEIVVPYDFTGKKDVTVYRKHGNTPAVALTRLAERPDGAFADGTFCTDTANGKVYIYTSKFSTYAIGYTAQTSASGSSGGSTIYYTLTATAGQGGSISPSGKVSLHRNGTKAFTITPDEGCLVADVLVDGKSVGPVMEYTFERITANHTIEVVFRKITSGAADCARDNTCLISKFPDAEPEAWYHDGVHYCLEQGLMVGTSETTFAPAMETSRAMIATIFWRLSGSPEAGAEMSFPDCEAGSWYAQAVAWCAEAGVVKGYDSGNFGSDDPITREQMALMLWRYAQLRGQDVSTGGEAGLLTYSDFDQAGAWAVSALRWAVGSGVMNGKDGNRLDPKGLVSRAEAAAVLQRFFEM